MLASHAQDNAVLRGDRAVPVLPTCGMFDPLRQGPDQPVSDALAASDPHRWSRPGALCVDPSEFTILDGYFGNSFTGATERVTIIGRRLDDWNKVCVRDECGAYLSSMQDAASRLVSLGHYDAASSAQVVNAILNELMPGYEDPCIKEDEPGADYLVRAAEHCRDYVHDALPDVLSPLEDLVAFFGCNPRVAEWQMTIIGRDELGDKSKVCKE